MPGGTPSEDGGDRPSPAAQELAEAGNLVPLTATRTSRLREGGAAEAGGARAPHTAEGTGGGVGGSSASFWRDSHAPRPGLCGQVRGPRTGASPLCAAGPCLDLCPRPPGSRFPGRGGGGEAVWTDGVWSVMGNLGGFLIFKLLFCWSFICFCPRAFPRGAQSGCQSRPVPAPGRIGGAGGGGRARAVASQPLVTK